MIYKKKDHSIIVLSDCKHLLWSNCCQNKDIITYLHKYCKLVNQKNVLGVVSWPNYDKIHILVHVIQPRHQFDHFIMCMKFAENICRKIMTKIVIPKKNLSKKGHSVKYLDFNDWYKFDNKYWNILLESKQVVCLILLPG